RWVCARVSKSEAGDRSRAPAEMLWRSAAGRGNSTRSRAEAVCAKEKHVRIAKTLAIETRTKRNPRPAVDCIRWIAARHNARGHDRVWANRIQGAGYL